MPDRRGLVAKQCRDVARGGELTQCSTEQLGLTGNRWVVEVQIGHVVGDRRLLDPVTGEQRGVAHIRASALLAAHEPHRLQLGVHPRSGHQRDALLRGELAMGGQSRTRGPHTGADLARKPVQDDLVARNSHTRHCMHDNFWTVMHQVPSIRDSPPKGATMHIAILTFEGYNELDSLIALGVLHRVKKPDWRVSICSPTRSVRSMNGVVIEATSDLEDACRADAVIVGSGMQTREVVEDPAIMARLRQLDPSRQLVAAQCSGALVLAKLGLLQDRSWH